MITKTPEIILALDVDNREHAQKILQATGERLEWVKVGLQSFLRDGPDLVHTIVDSGKKVFLDLKLHDIPNTMAKAMESLADLPIGMLTLHANAGEEALHRCAQVGKEKLPNTLLLAVTVLTSMNQESLHSVGVESPVIEQVERLASLAAQSEIGGIVCSPQELIRLRSCLPSETKLITPGIRPTGSAVGDQKRIMTPLQAKQAGADYLVIGRPILAASSPSQALDDILCELQG
ncbi:orotidine-5'-phosphate decarboxylase [Opitutales bacterium]|nr:orotidine-5'-phosphate decarboxylase [Opitutales bacterium]